MGWADNTKKIFKVTVDSLRLKYGKEKPLDQIIRELSKESGIPIQTLRRWYYEKSVVLNNNIPTCSDCGKNPVYIPRGKPLSIKSKHYGLCNYCRQKKIKRR